MQELSKYNNDIEQRTDEWYDVRLGRFTASDFYKLLVENKKKDGFGEVALKHMYSKASDIINGQKREVSSKSLEWGVYYEPYAKAELMLLFGDVKDIGFIEYGNHSGASPDMINEDYIFEIKCPYEFDNHLQNIRINTVEEFIKLRWEYYVQIQWQMFCAKKKGGYFFSYYPMKKNKLIFITRDEQLIEKCKQKLEAAVLIKNELIESYNNYEQKT